MGEVGAEEGEGCFFSFNAFKKEFCLAKAFRLSFHIFTMRNSSVVYDVLCDKWRNQCKKCIGVKWKRNGRPVFKGFSNFKI